MSPARMMWLGGPLGVFLSFLDALDATQSLAFIAFVFGMVFGKGYGVWEERSSRKEPANNG